MNFNLYLDDELGLEMTRVAQLRGASRNSLVRLAVREWLQRQTQPEWPPEVLAWTGEPDFPPFESERSSLLEPADPFL